MNKVEYLAGLFDGEGSVTYKQYWEKKKDRPNPAFVWRIRLEIAMTHKPTVEYAYNIFKLGWWGPRKVRENLKPQWRWAVSYRGAYTIAKALLPYSVTKYDKLKQIVDHYDKKESKEDIEYSGGKAYRVILKMFHDQMEEDKKNGNHTRFDRQHKG